MHTSKKHTIIKLILTVALLLIAYCLRFVFHPMTDNALLAIGMMTARWAIQVTLTVLWIASIKQRILLVPIRNMLLTVGSLLLSWQIIRIVKYDYVIITEPVGRYCWYAFYIAMIFVPLIGIFVIDHIGKREDYHSPGWMKYLFIPAVFLLVVVFTNDLHQLVFTFPNGFELYNSDYGYGFMYIIIMAWFVVLALFFAVRLLIKSRVPGSKSFQRLPLFITVFAIFFWAGYSFKLYAGDLTAVDCLFIIMLLEGAIQSGLIPSNMNYRELFEKSTIAAQIVDRNGSVHYSSANASCIDKDLMEKAKHAPVDLGDTLLHAKNLNGGYVYWQDDLKAINELAENLTEANETLSENYELMKAEVAIRERRLQVEEKSRLYDQIAQEITPQLNMVDAWLCESREHPEKARVLLSKVCVVSAYIKRRANLTLLGEEKKSISLKELESCFQESMDNLRLGGVLAHLDFACEGTVSVQQIISLYDLFESALERMLDCINAVMVTIQKTDAALRLCIQLGCKEKIPLLPAYELAFGTVWYDLQDEDLIINAVIDMGGDKA